MLKAAAVPARNARRLRERPGFWSWGRQGMPRLVLAVLLIVPAFSHGEDTRKLKNGVPPEYPELARRLNIRGIARVQVTVAPDGTVKDAKDLGGNPVLVDALIRAVKKWRYEPADRSSSIEVKFEFSP
jgi:TonB family protein